MTDKSIPEKMQSPLRAPAIAASAIMLIAIGALAGYWGWRADSAHWVAVQRATNISAARQAALNLTTIDYTHTDRDVQRILDASTGAFHNDFQARVPAFVEFVTKAQSKTQGTVTEAGVVSEDASGAQVLVALNVAVSTGGATDAPPRRWRMLITIERDSDSAPKASNVEFVP